jgi:hypothetical protein
MVKVLEPIKINYDPSVFLNADYTQHSGSCIQHQVYELTDIHKQYGGFPGTYTIKNTLIHQLWWDNTQVDFDELGRQLKMEIVTISSICQPPGNVIPLHRDTFFQIGQRHPARTELKVRANIYLEDYKMGHFIQYQENDHWVTSDNWRQGEGFMWDSSVIHLSANAGFENKYTLQISGFLIE